MRQYGISSRSPRSRAWHTASKSCDVSTRSGALEPKLTVLALQSLDPSVKFAGIDRQFDASILDLRQPSPKLGILFRESEDESGRLIAHEPKL